MAIEVGSEVRSKTQPNLGVMRVVSIKGNDVNVTLEVTARARLDELEEV